MSEGLDAHVVGAGREVLLQRVGDLAARAVRDDGVDERVAAAVRDVGFGESEAEEVPRVVGQAEVRLGVPARDGASSLGVGFEDDGELWGDQRVGSDALARESRVLRRDEVGVGAARTLRGEREQRLRHELEVVPRRDAAHHFGSQWR